MVIYQQIKIAVTGRNMDPAVGFIYPSPVQVYPPDSNCRTQASLKPQKPKRVCKSVYSYHQHPYSGASSQGCPIVISIVLLSTVDFNGCVFVKITSRLTEPTIAIRSLQTFFYLPDIAQHSQAVPDDMYF